MRAGPLPKREILSILVGLLSCASLCVELAASTPDIYRARSFDAAIALPVCGFALLVRRGPKDRLWYAGLVINSLPILTIVAIVIIASFRPD